MAQVRNRLGRSVRRRITLGGALRGRALYGDGGRALYGDARALRGRTERSPDRQNLRVKVLGQFQFQAPSPDASRLVRINPTHLAIGQDPHGPGYPFGLNVSVRRPPVVLRFRSVAHDVNYGFHAVRKPNARLT